MGARANTLSKMCLLAASGGALLLGATLAASATPAHGACLGVQGLGPGQNDALSQGRTGQQMALFGKGATLQQLTSTAKPRCGPEGRLLKA
jgi:hypothetical protein